MAFTAVFKSFQRFPLDTAIAVLLLLLYGPILVYWVDGWINKSISIQHEYFSHGLIGLPFAAYIIWAQRHQWSRLSDQTHPLGVLLIVLAFCFYLSNLENLINLSFPLLLTGLFLSLKGMEGLHLQSIPLAFIALATPTQLPYLIEPYALPLQHFIAAVAGFLLTQIGLNVSTQQIYLYLNGQTVEVAPHCAGLKILFTSFYVGLMLIYWSQLWRSPLRTALFTLGIFGISVIGNILRNTLLTYFHGFSRNQLFIWLHEGWGGDVYSALLLLSLLGLLSLIQSKVPKSLLVSQSHSVDL